MNHKEIIQKGKEINDIQIDYLIEEYEEKKNNGKPVKKTLNRIFDKINKVLHPAKETNLK